MTIRLFLSIPLTLILSLCIFPSAAYAQDGDSSLTSDIATTVIPTEDGEVSEVEVSLDTTPIGIVEDIQVSGDVVTSVGAVLRQMTFEIGDEISRRDIDLSIRRLLSFNGIYWSADISWEDSGNEGQIIVKVDLRARRTWFVSPSEVGGVIGDRNFMGTGDMASVAVFVNSDDHYYAVTWQDPQFLGGHNSFGVQLHSLDTFHTIRTDYAFTTRESYNIERNGLNLFYQTTMDDKYIVNVGYLFDKVKASKLGDPFKGLGDDDTFFFSGEEIPDGNVGVLSFGLSRGDIDSFFFPTRGYYWNVNTDIGSEFTGNDFEYARNTVYLAKFIDIYEGRNVLAGKVTYSWLDGDPPNYELIPFDWQVRGYTLGTHRGKSLLVMNFEYRFIMEPDIFQGVVFADYGRSWDGHELSLNDLEWGYGVGLRIHAGHFIPYNLLFRIDYGWGEYGSEASFGLNHFF